MATYVQLVDLQRDVTLRTRLMVACIVTAETIRTELVATPNHAARLAWAKAAYDNPSEAADGVVWSVLAQNRSADSNTILGLTDAALQTAVDAALNGIL